mgnify:CR=1 FL=1
MGIIFKIPAYIIFLVVGLWGFFISLGIVVDHLGFIGGTIAFFLAPATLSFAPWYEAIANSNWFPVILVYGGGIVAAILYFVGLAIDGD